MKIESKGGEFFVERKLEGLDLFCMDFCKILNAQGLQYVIVSGYVSILFGRSRNSEDIDLILGKLGMESFARLWEALQENFECINAGTAEEAYGYLTDPKEGHSIRFAKKGEFVPNVELKFPKESLDLWSLQKRKQATLNGFGLFISPLELQIPYKLLLGSDKDYEDALHIYRLFQDTLDKGLMEGFAERLKVSRKLSDIYEGKAPEG